MITIFLQTISANIIAYSVYMQNGYGDKIIYKLGASNERLLGNNARAELFESNNPTSVKIRTNKHLSIFTDLAAEINKIPQDSASNKGKDAVLYISASGIFRPWDIKVLWEEPGVGMIEPLPLKKPDSTIQKQQNNFEITNESNEPIVIQISAVKMAPTRVDPQEKFSAYIPDTFERVYLELLPKKGGTYNYEFLPGRKIIIAVIWNPTRRPYLNPDNTKTGNVSLKQIHVH